MSAESRRRRWIERMTPEPEWTPEELAMRAFVEDHGQPTHWEIEGGAGDYLTCHYHFADGAVMTVGGAPIEETP